jgi:UDPglucose 6-dehydrogenase
LKIGIAGYGFVGQAQELILKDYHDIIVSDPNQGHYGDLRHADAVIVCVSTPPREDGSCHMDNVFDVIDSVRDVPILIKSTISVEGWRMLADLGKNLTFSPEFLRAKHWRTDALENKNYYFGGDSCNYWSDIFLRALGNINVTIENPEDLVAAKALRNSFLALKVSFFNQVFDYAQAHRLDYEAVANVIGADERIGCSHTSITKERGYGGHCFPKDVRAVIKSGQAYGCRLTLLEEADAYNSTIRRDTSQD